MEKESCCFTFARTAREEKARKDSHCSALNSQQSINTSEDVDLDHGKFYSVSEKHFFRDLVDYVQGVDLYLRQIVCSYHNILKNSLLQSINSDLTVLNNQSESDYSITHQLCYFKNINVQNKRQMKRRNLEYSIK